MEPLVFHEKQTQKKDLFTIIDELLEDLPRQERSSMNDIVLQDKFAF